jgi:hypothetical protein
MEDVMGKRVGLLGGALVFALGSGALAQSPSPVSVTSAPSDRLAIGERFEVPDQGFAVAFPYGWTVEVMDSDLMASTGMSAQGGHYFVAAQPIEKDETCTVLVSESTETAPSSMAAAVFADGFRRDAGVTSVASDIVSLPVGSAPRLDVILTTGDGRTMYFFTDDEAMHYWLTCGADHLPDDRWLSVAETFEFLPAEE